MEVGERYLALVLRLARLDPYVVDYSGAAELRASVEREPEPSAAALADEARGLRAELDDSRRGRWLAAQLEGIELATRRLGGERFPYGELVRRCHGAEATVVDDGVFADAHARLDGALPGRGSLRGRYLAWLERQRVPRELVGSTLAALLEELRERTRAAFGLPEGEAVEAELVAGKRWAAYAEHDGPLRTRVMVNTDLPLEGFELLELCAHEAYPGHHTEHVLKARLGGAELAAVVHPTPQALVCEGIAQLALSAVLGEDAERVAAERLRPLGVHYDAEAAGIVRAARNELFAVRSNLAIALDEGSLSAAGAREYARHWLLESEERVEKTVTAIEQSNWPPYEHCYTEGLRLCRRFAGAEPDGFRRLLTEQLTSADLTAA